MMERRIGDQGRRVERKRDAHTGDEVPASPHPVGAGASMRCVRCAVLTARSACSQETNDETFNLEDEEAFEREFHVISASCL